MARHLGMVLLLLAVPQAVRAQQAPEDLLPAGTQIYLRWDGIDAHRAAYEKTALGKMLQGDTGKFLTNLVTQLQDNLGALLTVEQLLKGIPPAKLMKLQSDAAEAPKLLEVLGRKGFILGVDVRKVEPPDAQLTLILPDAGDKPAPLFGTLRLITGLTGGEIKEVKIDGHKVQHLALDPVHLAAWVAGKHLVLTIGTDQPAAALKRAHAKGGHLTDSPLFQKVRSFNQFETSARAFVDVAAFVKMAHTVAREGVRLPLNVSGPGGLKPPQDLVKDVAKLLNDLALDKLQAITLYSGFDGDAERGLIEMDVPGGASKGVFRLFSGKPFQLADVPPLPQDVTSWSMTNFDPGIFYDLALTTAENVLRLVSPEDANKVREFGKQADAILGVDLRQDLLGALDDKFVMYSSPAEGPFQFGQTFLFKVKDPQKLQTALTQAIKGIGRATGVDISVKKRTYHGVELREVQVRQQGFFFVPSYAIHKDWIAFSYFPQPVQGYILRATGELPPWKPEPRVGESLEKLPREVVSISMSDPRPTVKQLLSLAPLIGGAIKSFFPDIKFDVGAMPNSLEATRYLFPNVSVASFHGNTLRMESRSSLELPVDLGGLDTYAIFAFLAFAGAFF